MRTSSLLLVTLVSCAPIPSDTEVAAVALAKPTCDPPLPHHLSKCKVIGSNGGTLTEKDGPTLVVPPNALTADVAITISTATDTAPSGATTPIYSFDPPELTFGRPASVTIPAASGSIYWSNEAASGFDRLGGAVSVGAITTAIPRLGSGYVGPTSGPRMVYGTVTENDFVDDELTGARYPDVARVFQPTFLLAGVVPGTGVTVSADGRRFFAQLPDGPYLLSVTDPIYGSLFYASSASTIDAGTDAAGRADAAVATSTASISLSLRKLIAWDTNDGNEALVAFAPETPMTWTLQTSTIVNGATMFDTVISTPDDANNSYLIDSTAGDTFSVVQITTQGNYVAQTRVLTDPVDQADCSPSDPAACMTTITDNFGHGHAQSATATFAGSQFAAELGLDGSGIYENAGATASAGGASFLYLATGCPGTVCLTTSADDATIDTTFTNLAFVTPKARLFDAGFGYDISCSASIALGAEAPTFIACDADGVAAPGADMVPVVSPIRAPLVNGMDATVPVTGAGLRPVLAWSPPALGAADHYVITIIGLDDDVSNGTTDRFVLGWMTTTETSIQIPDLSSFGGHDAYAFRIQTESGVDLQRNYTPPIGRARYVTATVTP